MQITMIDAIIRILEAFVLSSLIGLDREKTKRPAGLRTHVIVTLGSCLVTIVPLFYADAYPNVDPTRMAAQVISGIGFLGAGTILRYGESVVGLTTAASLWSSACLGIAAGMGIHEVTIFTGILIVTVLKIVPYIERKFLNKVTEFNVQLKIAKDRNDLMAMSKLMKKRDINIRSVNIELDEEKNKLYKFNLSAKDNDTKKTFLADVYKLDVIGLEEHDEEEI